MLKQTVTYTDFEGNEVSEDFYFHLNKAEIAELEVSEPGGLTARLTEVTESENAKDAFHFFKLITEKAIGMKSDDGKRFVKTDEARSAFFDTDAYSEFFMNVLTDVDASVNFMNNVLPRDLIDAASKELASKRGNNKATTKGN